MIVVTDPVAGTVTIRLSTLDLVVRGVVATVVAIGSPAAAQRWAPWALVPALLLTAAAAAWVVAALGRAAVFDDRGVTLAATRRRVRRIEWAQVDDLTTDDGRFVVRTVAGHEIRGPRCRSALVADARREAVRLGLVSGDPG